MVTKKYNRLKRNQYLDVSTIEDLFEIIKDVVDKDIRQWIESEGAYKVIQKASGFQENLIQKTIKTQFENCLYKRGIRGADIIRETQLLSDKKIDFLISYGFIGPVLVEIKLTSNTEVHGAKNIHRYKTKLIDDYMKGTNSSHALFVLF